VVTRGYSLAAAMGFAAYLLAVWPHGGLRAESTPRVILRQNLIYSPEGHSEVEYSWGGPERRIRVHGFAFMPFQCEHPDSLSPLAFPCGPTPFSTATVVFSVLGVADFEVEVLTELSESKFRAGFRAVKPGPYVLTIEGEEVPSGEYRVQFHYAGRRIGQPQVCYVGSS
jgi:hypothetical protein